MNVRFALLADAANSAEDGSLNVLGARTHLSSRNLPTIVPRISIVVRFNCTVFDLDKPFKIEVRVRDSDGDIRHQSTGLLEVIGDDVQLRGYTDFIFNAHNTVFTDYETYQFSMDVDGAEVATLPLTLGRLKDEDETAN